MTSRLHKNWPDVILPTPKTERPFRELSGHVLQVNLNDYDAVVKDGGQRVWDLYLGQCRLNGIKFDGIDI